VIGFKFRERRRYERDVAAFAKYASRFDTPGLDKFFWYHTVDLENGVCTPGDYDYRRSIEAFGFPGDMSGMTSSMSAQQRDSLLLNSSVRAPKCGRSSFRRSWIGTWSPANVPRSYKAW
jgi:hypothetical protein